LKLSLLFLHARSHNRISYWEERYKPRPDKVPRFLEKVSDKILTTGKYLNVLRECNVNVEYPDAAKLRFIPNYQGYADVVEKVYSFASKRLLDYLWHEQHLMGRLSSIKRYFLMEQGDFFVHFMETADEELRKRVSEIVTATKLESLLELSLRTSNANSDSFKDDLSCVLLKYSLIQEL